MSLFIKSVTFGNYKIGILEGRLKQLHLEKPNGLIRFTQEDEVAAFCVDSGSIELINLVNEHASYKRSLTSYIKNIFRFSDDLNRKSKAFAAHCLQNKIVLNQSQIESSQLLINLGANLEQLVNNIQRSNLDNKIENIDIDFV